MFTLIYAIGTNVISTMETVIIDSDQVLSWAMYVSFSNTCNKIIDSLSFWPLHTTNLDIIDKRSGGQYEIWKPMYLDNFLLLSGWVGGFDLPVAGFCLNGAMGIDLSRKYLGMKGTFKQIHFNPVASLPVAIL